MLQAGGGVNRDMEIIGDLPVRRSVLALLAVGSLAACEKPAPRELAIKDAWVRLAAVPGNPAAAYFTVHGGAAADRLTAITSDKVATVEMHRMGMEGGMMTMEPLTEAVVPANGDLIFATGGNHAMLFGADPSVKPGGKLPLTFRFKSGKALTAEAKVLAAGDAAPDRKAP